MIPKILHYCWFGHNPFPPIIEKCLATWQEILPDYEIKRWDESNFDVYQNTYIKEAYDNKKYAFVSDFARFDILYKEGGIYLDTDVEVLKPFDIFLENKMFTGFENEKSVAPGLILGAVPEMDLIKTLRDHYKDKSFLYPNGMFNTESVVAIMTKLLQKKGLVLNGKYQNIEEMIIYPVEYFSPKGYDTGKLLITDNTYTIHHYAGSWLSTKDLIKIKLHQILNKFLGPKLFQKFRSLLVK